MSEDLERYAGCAAFLAIVLNRYPRGSGNRDNICLALAGTLIRAGFTDDEVDSWLTHVASLAEDEEASKRGGKAAASREKWEAGDELGGSRPSANSLPLSQWKRRCENGLA
jgi:hypothetical protein